MEKIIALFERARAYEMEVAVQLEHIERLRKIAARTRDNPYSDAEYAAEICEKLARLETDINAKIDCTADAKREALVYLSYLEGEELTVLYGYYMLGYSWEEIADKNYMSLRRVYLLRKSGLRKIEEHFVGRIA